MASFWYNRGKKEVMDNTIALLTDTIHVILLKSTYTPNADHDFISSLTPATNELSGTGYARKALASKAITESDALDKSIFDAADVVYTSMNAGTAAYIVIAKSTGTDSTSVLIALIDMTASTIISNGGDVTLQWDANGILQLS